MFLLLRYGHSTVALAAIILYIGCYHIVHWLIVMSLFILLYALCYWLNICEHLSSMLFMVEFALRYHELLWNRLEPCALREDFMTNRSKHNNDYKTMITK